MPVECNDAYERGKLALYVAGLLPDDPDEAQAVLDLAGRLLPVLTADRAAPDHPRERGG